MIDQIQNSFMYLYSDYSEVIGYKPITRRIW